MKKLKICFLLLFAICALFSFRFVSATNKIIDAQDKPAQEKNAQEKSTQRKSANEFYAENCARCHGADGRGETEYAKTHKLPNIAHAKWQKRHNDKKIRKAIANGGGGMPAYKDKLTADEIDALVAHVRTLKQ